MDFKEALKADLQNTFHNINEFAKKVDVYYDGECFESLPVVITGMSKERKKNASDHEMGLFLNEKTAFINSTDMPVEPRKNHIIEINDVEYKIIESKEELGQHVLSLEVIDE